MYIYKFIITFDSGQRKDEWLCGEDGESLASLKDRAEKYLDDLESREDISHIKMTRRTVPGI